MNIEREPGLKIDSALESDVSFFGLPLPIFAFATLFGGFGVGLLIHQLGLLLGLLVGGVYLLIVFAPLKIVHKEDLRAWSLWLYVLSNPRFTSININKKEILIISGNRVLSYRDWRKKSE